MIARMFLRAGALSLALLLASRLLGVVRESAQAAVFGSGGLADVAVLVLTLPDWLASVVASGALAYVLLPAWGGQPPQQVAALQRRVATWALVLGVVLALLLALARDAVLAALGAGIPSHLRGTAAGGLVWSAVAIPAALLAALWATRLQHERDFVGMYGANLVVNGLLVATILVAGAHAGAPVTVLGIGLVIAMAGRLRWLGRRLPAVPSGAAARIDWPTLPVWAWAWLSAGLPLALPFVARSVASQAGEGALAVFSYAWKLVELPLILAIQLVASLAFPAITRALGEGGTDGAPVRRAFALAWTLACAAAAGLLLAGPALARLLFGWGRMTPEALEQVARWGMAGAWGLLPQALTAVALTVLATRRRMAPAVVGYGLALLAVLGASAAGWNDGLRLMHLLNACQALVAAVCLLAIGPECRRWLPWETLVWGGAGLALAAGVAALLGHGLPSPGWAAQLAAGAVGAALVLLLAAWRSGDVREALRR
jgi:peptidoglycan biosynthesis protein MviN/MurJ (putative lipid II flippase)